MKQTVTKLESQYMDQYEAHVRRRQRRKKQLINRLITFAVATAVVIGLLTSYHINQRALYSDKAKEYEQLQEELQALKVSQTELEEEINLLNNDDYVLEIARSNYFFSKKGELLFKLPSESSSN